MIEKLELEQNPLSETVEKIREICPAAVTRDGKIDFEELKTSLATDVAEDTIEKYEFTWVGKNAAKAEANRPIRKTLRPVVADSKDYDNTKNLYIEGDNLDALKLLQESYLGKVKMIYIDPPYNTGNDFVYCDNFKMGCAEFMEKSGQCDADGNRLFANTKTNGRFHSDWCSMMYPRLKIARNLLTDDGVIFISIDDNEVANLRKICDEVFGEDNFVALVPRLTSAQRPSQEKYISKTNDYIVVYAKSKQYDFNRVIQRDLTNLKHDNRGAYIEGDTSPILASATQGYSAGGDYDIEVNGKIYKPVDSRGNRRRWLWTEERMRKAIELGIVVETASSLRVRNYIDKEFQVGTNILVDKDPNLIMTSNDLMNSKYVNNLGTSLLSDLDIDDFDFPKPISLLDTLLKLATDKNAVILDFFSGSATTAHAVMQLNAEDGGNRRFIMVQLPEKCDNGSQYANICEIGKERIRRAGEKIKAEHPDKDLDIGFRVLHVDSDNMADIAKRPSDITQGQLKLDVENIVPKRSDLDLLFGVMVDCGLMLDMPIETKQMDDKTYYVVNHGDLVACFEKNIPEKLIYEIARMNPVCAVFRDSSFAEPKDKINLAEIFKNITGNDKCVKVL
ncbi:MAG: site-specific DNA-methyltransferase [Pseudomonadota bacterium]|nr:site-specific DNA-methyltransferase [Pseudomonadota bacterium]